MNLCLYKTVSRESYVVQILTNVVAGTGTNNKTAPLYAMRLNVMRYLFEVECRLK